MLGAMVQNFLGGGLSHRAERENGDAGEGEDLQGLANHERKDIRSFRV
jgi:hypothetical protein